ncbi:hypothetical protein [Herbiconiux sp.]|uniref:hypothetical protein n=1 Tax=Herbiconiux sp. TaxID=1871186 RepID=UPI0025C6570C|nr:hypothetical protein [Herbiconiux sp.]
MVFPAALIVVGLMSGCSAFGADPSASGSAKPASPLDPYYAALYPKPDDAAQKASDAAVQDAVAVCMKEQGFDYKPDLNSTTTLVMDPEMEWGSEEFAKTNGYGITTDISGLTGAPSGEYVDPNQQYIDSLSPTEQTAYNDALWGAPLVDPDASGDDASAEVGDASNYDWHDAGCMGAAQHEHGLFSDPADDPEYASLTEEMGALYEKAHSSPAVQAEEEEWSSCLASAGYPGFEHKDDPLSHFSDRMGELQKTGDGLQAGQPSDLDPAALAALQEEEIATAVADFDCARDTGYAETLQREQTRIEQEFVDENKDRLDALVARLGAQ